MHIQPSFWTKLRRLCAEHIDLEEPLRSQLDKLISSAQMASGKEKHQRTATLFTALGRLPEAVELGFQIGERVPVTAYGILSLGALTAPTVGDALKFIANAHLLMIPLIDCRYEESATEGRLTLGFRHPIDSAGEAVIIAACTAAVETELARRSGRLGNLSRLELTSSSKGAEASYRKCLSLTPRPDASANTLVFKRAVLDLSNVHGDVETFSSVIDACAELVERQACGTPLQGRAREAVMSGIGAPPSQQRLAKLLDLTPRQLRVSLRRQCTSYQAIIRDCRIEYASALLQNPALSLSQIADRLGYSDLPAFSHAFCRWTGKSPSAYRVELRSRGEPA